MSLEDLRGHSRSRVLVNARQVAMYLCRELTDLSLPRIGQAFGGRDHTTVMHADRKIRQQMAERRSLYNQIAELTNRIKQTPDVAPGRPTESRSAFRTRCPRADRRPQRRCPSHSGEPRSSTVIHRLWTTPGDSAVDDWGRRRVVHRRRSTCGRPVEGSGDNARCRPRVHSAGENPVDNRWTTGGQRWTTVGRRRYCGRPTGLPPGSPQLIHRWITPLTCADAGYPQFAQHR